MCLQRVHVDQHRDLDPVARGEGDALEHVAGGGDLARKRLAEAGELREVEVQVRAGEEFGDAADILRPESGGGGVLRSAYTNKMNEVKPHRAWAERTVLRAEVFGVAREDVSFVDLLAAGVHG